VVAVVAVVAAVAVKAHIQLLVDLVLVAKAMLAVHQQEDQARIMVVVVVAELVHQELRHLV
jgi:hypothetical protein